MSLTALSESATSTVATSTTPQTGIETSAVAAAFTAMSKDSTASADASSILASLQSELSATQSAIITTGTDSAGNLFTSTIPGRSTSTSVLSSTRSAVIYVPTSTVPVGATPIYELSLDTAQLSSYGIASDNGTTFICANEDCQFTVINDGYSDLWRSIMNTTDLYVAPSRTKLTSLTNGTSNYTVYLVNQDDVNWRNEGTLYQWGLFNSGNATIPVATSEYFQMHTNEWNYTSGMPQAGANGTTANSSRQSGRKPALSVGAVAGVVIGGLLILVVASTAWIVLRRRRQKDKRTSPLPNIHEKGNDNPSSKPELVGTPAVCAGLPYNKPELAAISKPMSSNFSSSQPTSIPHGGGTGSPRDVDIPYEGGAGAPTEPDQEQEKQVTESERLVPHYMEFRKSRNGELSSPTTQNPNKSSPMITPAPHENLNVLKAQEREMAHKMEVSEELQRMRAEHAALLDRIRIVEMREREIHGRS